MPANYSIRKFPVKDWRHKTNSTLERRLSFPENRNMLDHRKKDMFKAKLTRFKNSFSKVSMARQKYELAL